MGSPGPSARQRVLAHSQLLAMSDPFPEIKSTHSLVAKHVTKPIWDKLSRAVTKTSGFTLAQAIACATEFDNQHCGIYAGDWDSYKVFADVFDPLIQDYNGISADATHTSDMDVNKIKGNVDPSAPVHSCRIRVGRSIDGFGTRGESGGQTGITYDISNKHRLGHSEVELVQKMIDGVNTLHKEDNALKAKHGL